MQDSPQISRTDSTGHLIGRMWRDWMSAYKPRVAMAVALMIVVAAASAAYPKLIETSVDMLEAKNANVVWMMPLAIILVTFIKGLASYGQSVLSQSVRSVGTSSGWARRAKASSCAVSSLARWVLFMSSST